MFSTFGIVDYLTYVLGTIAIILLPGPNSMYCMYVAGSQGIKKGYQAALAIFVGDTILMLLAVFGAGALLKTSEVVFFTFKILGGLYLAYIGLNLLIACYKGFTDSKHQLTADHLNPIDDSVIAEETAINPQNTIDATNKSNKIGSTGKNADKDDRVFIKALTLSLSNPKAILFFLSFFIQFVNPSYDHPMVSFAILGVTLQVISMLYLSLIIVAGSNLANFFKRRYKLAALGNGLIGGLFMSFAVTLWRAEAT